MKNILVAISALFYLAISSGVIINIHYCMKRVDSVKLFAEATDVCGRCGMHSDEANGCCHDEVKVIKITDDQRASQIFALADVLPGPPVITPSVFLIAPFENSTTGPLFYPDHPPPLLKGQDTYLQHCVFRI